MDNKASFVFYETFYEVLSVLPADSKLKFYEALTEYGLFEKEPEFTGIEKALWIQMKFAIDNAKERYNKRVENGKKGGAPKNNQNAQKTTETELVEPKTTENNLIQPNSTENNLIQPNSTENNRKQPNSTENNLNDNDNDNDNDNVNVNLNESADGSLINTNTEESTAGLKTYSDTIFEIFKKSNMPCANGNPLSFYQRDFKNGLAYIHHDPELKILGSDEIISACKNYVAVANHALTYPGYRHKYSFERFVKWDKFLMYIPANFVPDNFKDHKAKAT